jgi:hypothetical protein
MGSIELVLELAKKAGIKGQNETGLSPNELHFVQLIVEECAHALAVQICEREYAQARDGLTLALKDHFMGEDEQ